MAQSACAALGHRITAGLVAGPHGPGSVPSHVDWIDAAHPLADEGSVRAASLALELAAGARAAGEVLLVLLSGGGSAMLAAPAPGLSLQAKQRTVHALMRAGADIVELNCVRKHLSAIKGGRLGAAAGHCLTLALSDVHTPEDDPGTIASGPTVTDVTTYADAIAVIDRRRCDVPDAVRAHLERGAAGGLEETPKPGDPGLRDSAFVVIGNRRTAMRGAELEATRRGYSVRIVDAPTRGEARVAGRQFAEMAAAANRLAGPQCVIASGETTVTVRGDGLGGRNQEFVLGAAEPLAAGSLLALAASLGTDGIDGPTEASGAIASSTTISRAAALGIDVDDVLARNDSYAALARLDDLIKWGPTRTNVGDVHVLLTMGS
jgi:glycerate 2-kinase